MNDLMNIPTNIVVGFQNRGGTYTGKLAYVVYKDHKNVLRKESSWNSWRDKDIPTEGFVLNKKAGGTSWGWNQRNTYCRVYDPRGFEFEISIENLLFILQECSSLKGKGLEGEFVYAWDRADLVLLPASSQEYTTCMEFSEAKSKKVTKKEMLAGCMYKTKDMEEVMYLGRYNYFESIRITYSKEAREGKKKHIFLDKEGGYWVQAGFTKLAERLTTEPSHDFSDKLEEFLNGDHHQELDKIVIEKDPTPIKWEKDNWAEHKNASFFIQKDGACLYIHAHTPYMMGNFGSSTYGSEGSAGYHKSYDVIVENNILPYTKYDRGYYGYGGRDGDIKTTIEELQEMRVKVFAVMKNGKRFELTRKW